MNAGTSVGLVILPETERSRLRDFTPADFEALHDFVSRPVVCRYTDWGPNQPADTRAFVAEAAAGGHRDPREDYTLAVVRQADSRLVGSAALWRESRQHARGGLGFVFHPEVWGQGFATETAELLLQVGFDRLGLQRVEATRRPDNVASRRALEKAGFQVEGLLRSHVVVHGTRQDSLVLSALRR
jgi:RimJ/RimL family protein N-acetyltransferase